MEDLLKIVLPKVPRFILPEDKQDIFKFVQFNIKEEPFLRYKSILNFHVTFDTILSDALAELEIDPLRDDYEFVGSGIMTNLMYCSDKYFLFSSSENSLKPNKKHLKKLINYIPNHIKLMIEEP